VRITLSYNKASPPHDVRMTSCRADCYLFPVSAHGPLPAFLLATDVKVHRTNCLMLVIVHGMGKASTSSTSNRNRRTVHMC
jgi:hypothetical protein